MAKRKRYIDGDVQAAIEELAQDQPTWTATQIYRQLEQREELRGRLPTVRTVQTIVKDVRPRDTSAAWSLAIAGPDEAAAVLPVLAAVVESTRGEVRTLTQREAGWIAKLRAVAADLPARETYRLARLFIAREDRSEPSADLDLFIAFAPWRNRQASDRYDHLLFTMETLPPFGDTRDAVVRIFRQLAAESDWYERERRFDETDPTRPLQPGEQDNE
ncbi:MAG: helix-turn-helix domain-containing protein [Dehalococcoidia bacterium]